MSMGDEIVVIESVKAGGEVLSHLSAGVEVGVALSEEPELVSRDPKEEGWFFNVRPAEAGKSAELLGAEDYQALIADL